MCYIFEGIVNLNLFITIKFNKLVLKAQYSVELFLFAVGQI